MRAVPHLLAVAAQASSRGCGVMVVVGNFNNQIASLAGTVGTGSIAPRSGRSRPTSPLSAELDKQLTAINKGMNSRLPRLNAILKAAGLPELKPSTEQVKPRPNTVS
ncbi:MAG: hypothetical protein IPK33_33185 [Gemmatimonadetes bacterium]|nr:hypothetical protein [Gemmatimonadota bacterium]